MRKGESRPYQSWLRAHVELTAHTIVKLVHTYPLVQKPGQTHNQTLLLNFQTRGVFSKMTPSMSMSMSMNNGTDSDQKGMAMSAIFRGGTQITLFAPAFSTTSLGAYLAALVALFLLAWFNRFLAALRYQLDATQNIPGSAPSSLPLQSFATSEEWDDGVNSAPSAGLIPDFNKRSHASNDRLLLRRLACPFPTWVASRPWGWRIDGINTLLEGIRALTGYLL